MTIFAIYLFFRTYTEVEMVKKKPMNFSLFSLLCVSEPGCSAPVGGLLYLQSILSLLNPAPALNAVRLHHRSSGRL